MSTLTASPDQSTPAHASRPVRDKRRRATAIVPTLARKMVAVAFLFTATLGFVSVPGASAQHDTYACNNLFRSGHGYYGCGGLQEMWYTGNYGWTLYYW